MGLQTFPLKRMTKTSKLHRGLWKPEGCKLHFVVLLTCNLDSETLKPLRTPVHYYYWPHPSTPTPRIFFEKSAPHTGRIPTAGQLLPAKPKQGEGKSNNLNLSHVILVLDTGTHSGHFTLHKTAYIHTFGKVAPDVLQRAIESTTSF